MALTKLNVRFTVRGDTKDNWYNANPVLLQNELGRETDTNRIKYGDGVKAWNDLDYADKSLSDAIQALQDQFSDGKANAAETADKLATARNITLTGAVTGSTTFDGSENVEINATLSNFDASKITTGTIDIARLPKGALDNLLLVADDTERLALTTEKVQNGNSVKVTATGIMYFVSDETKLGTAEAANAFTEYTAGRATAVDWSGVENKPNEFKPEAHTHAASDITAMTGYTGTYFDETDSLNAALKKVEDKVVLASERYTLPTATADVLGGVKIGANITSTDGKISITKSNVTNALGYTPPEQDTTYEEATESTAGLMSAADKTKLDDLENYTLKAATADTLGGVKIGKNISVTEDGTISIADAPDLTPYAKKTDVLTGDLTGTVAAPSISNGAVVTAKLADGAVTDVKIAAASLSTSKLFVPSGDTLILDGGTAVL